MTDDRKIERISEEALKDIDERMKAYSVPKYFDLTVPAVIMAFIVGLVFGIVLGMMLL